MLKTWLFWLAPGLLAAQAPGPRSAATGGFGGLAVGNGLEVHGGYLGPRLLAMGRIRYKWWGPESGPDESRFGTSDGPRSRQAEAAALLGYPLVVSRTVVYAATGLAYVNGRQLGEYRYSVRPSSSSLLPPPPCNFYAYRDYQAVGLPLEVGVVSPPLGPDLVRVGVVGQANLNPQQSVYCLLATFWFGNLIGHPLPKP